LNILVTGGAGFIGSEMTRQLVHLGHNVIVLDSLTYAGRIESIAAVRDVVTFMKIDIRDKKALDKFFEEHVVEVVINLTRL
jgi:dTDP-glucose 4,6-dehydratase